MGNFESKHLERQEFCYSQGSSIEKLFPLWKIIYYWVYSSLEICRQLALLHKFPHDTSILLLLSLHVKKFPKSNTVLVITVIIIISSWQLTWLQFNFLLKCVEYSQLLYIINKHF